VTSTLIGVTGIGDGTPVVADPAVSCGVLGEIDLHVHRDRDQSRAPHRWGLMQKLVTVSV
jgi:hypothetical protein